MQRHDPTQCIVQNSFGTYHVYPCSVDVAKQLLTEVLNESGTHMYPEEQKIWDNPENLVVDKAIIKRAIEQIMNATEDKPGFATHSVRHLKYGPCLDKDNDSRPVITKDECKELQKELLQWALNNDISIPRFTSLNEELFGYGAKKKYDLLSLPFMDGMKNYAASKNKTIQFMAEDAIAFLSEKRTLLRDRWKENARTTSVVQQYLSFINNLTHRDNKFELGHIELEYAPLINASTEQNVDTSPTSNSMEP